jgi:hypothetical protein
MDTSLRSQKAFLPLLFSYATLPHHTTPLKFGIKNTFNAKGFAICKVEGKEHG